MSGEDRALVVARVGFANPFVFPPAEYGGIAGLRLPRHATPVQLSGAVRPLAAAITARPIEGRLRVVDADRARKYRGEDGDGC